MYQKRALIQDLIRWRVGSKGWTCKGLWRRSGCEKGSKPGAKKCIKRTWEATYRDSRVLGWELWGEGEQFCPKRYSAGWPSQAVSERPGRARKPILRGGCLV